ncbi:hypothetical protein TNCV_5080981 [Trichonephila clavipes]|nr:hypothetical protein TNCV_5080981 [Trichonephila clavipes]
MVDVLLFQKFLPGSNKISVHIGSEPPCMSGMKETVLMLLCLGQAVGERKLLLLGFDLRILELNGMCWVLKIALLVRIAIGLKPLLSTSWLVLVP